MSDVVRQFIREALCEPGFIRHLERGLPRRVRQDNAAAYQIASDWLEEVELRRGDLLSPGYVAQVERYVAEAWPELLEQFRGDEWKALQTMTNLLASRYSYPG